MIRKITDIIKEKIKKKEPVYSFEVFPPKTSDGIKKLFSTIETLSELNPAYISVTYGAGGSTSKSTLDIIQNIQKQFDIACMHHFTLVNQTADELKRHTELMMQAGVRNVLALRGDPPKEMGEQFRKIEGGIEYCYELIDLIKEVSGEQFSIGVAGFPECHIDCLTEELDSNYLKLKVDHGAEFVVTQLFFDNTSYSHYIDRIAKAGVQVPVIPGVLPITDYRRLLKFCDTCGAYICWDVHKIFAPISRNVAETVDKGIQYAIDQCEDLIYRGAPGIHFYALNKTEPVRTIWDYLKSPTKDLKKKNAAL